MVELAIISLAGLGAALQAVATRYSVTSHGDNPWTFDAFWNCITHVRVMEEAIAFIKGSINVAYRCPSVNAAVGGVANSYHMRGLAIDIHPGPGFTPESGSRALYAAAAAGKFGGTVRTVIWEPTWCHIEWHDPQEMGPPAPCRFLKKVGSGYETVKP